MTDDQPTVYLAGPVMSYADGGASWRESVKRAFGDEYDLRDPLAKYNVSAQELEVVDGRSDPAVEETVGVDEIVEGDMQLLDESEGVLVGYTQVRSTGTPMEVMYARERGMPVAVWVRDDTDFEDLSPWYRYHATALTTDVELGLQHIRGQTPNTDDRPRSPVREALDLLDRVVDPHTGAELNPNYEDVQRARELLRGVFTGDRCPGCGAEGGGDDVLANHQLWCPDDCRVVSFRDGGDRDA
jgi:nucleoside 2-deoxyribosyltransferase